MTTITTREALAAIPVGQPIRVRVAGAMNQWARTEDGFTPALTPQVTVPFDLFASMLTIEDAIETGEIVAPVDGQRIENSMEIESAPLGWIIRTETGSATYCRAENGWNTHRPHQHTPTGCPGSAGYDTSAFRIASNWHWVFPAEPTPEPTPERVTRENFVGRWYAVNGEHLYGFGLFPEGHGFPFRAARFSAEGEFICVDGYMDGANWTIDPTPPSRVPARMLTSFRTVGAELGGNADTENRLRGEVQTLTTSRDSFREQRDRLMRQVRTINEGLNEWLDENEEDRDSELDRLVEEWGMDRRQPEQEEVTVRVDIRGTFSLDYDDAERMIHEQRLVDVSDGIEIEFTCTASIDKTVDEGDCACEDICDDDVEAWLDDNNVSYSGFSVETRSCLHC